MNSCKLREEKLKWFRQEKFTNEYGEYLGDPVYLGTMRAGLLNQSETKSFMNDELQFVQRKRFIIRHYVKIKENDVIEWQGKKWVVDEVIPNKYYRDQEIDVTLINE